MKTNELVMELYKKLKELKELKKLKRNSPERYQAMKELEKNMKPLPPEFSKMVDDHFWELF